MGFYNGHVIVLNIVNREKTIIGENVPGFEPVWDVVWRANLDPNKETEQVCASFDDGRVMFYTIENTKNLQVVSTPYHTLFPIVLVTFRDNK